MEINCLATKQQSNRTGTNKENAKIATTLTKTTTKPSIELTENQSEIQKQQQKQADYRKKAKLISKKIIEDNQQQLNDEQRQQKQKTTTITTTAAATATALPPIQRQRNKLKRWPAKQVSLEQSEINEETATKASNENSVYCGVAMGGGFTPPPLLLATTILTSKSNLKQTYESKKDEKKTQQKTATATETTTTPTTTTTKEQRKEKTEKLKLSKKDTQKQQQQPQTGTKEKPNTTSATKTKPKSSTSLSKTSKFADKLRRSFRRSGNKAVELKKLEKNLEQKRDISTTSPSPSTPLPAVSPANNQKKQSLNEEEEIFDRFYKNSFQQEKQQQKQSTRFGFFDFIKGNVPSTSSHQQLRFSQQNLNSLNSNKANSSNCEGGYINAALLLDSPDEATPPEFAYYHLDSVATTNSNTSLESNFDNLNINANSVGSGESNFWTWPQEKNYQAQLLMGDGRTNNFFDDNTFDETETEAGELNIDDYCFGASNYKETSKSENFPTQTQIQTPTTSTTTITPTTTTTTTTTTTAITTKSRQFFKFFKNQTNNKSDNQPTINANCSLTNENSSQKFQRLENCTQKLSNESHNSSYRGHSNEAFTISSHNSSSGEWENIFGSTSYNNTSSSEFHASSLTEQFESIELDNDSTTDLIANERNNYTYSLASPNNPFLTQIFLSECKGNCVIETEHLNKNSTSVQYLSANNQLSRQFAITTLDGVNKPRSKLSTQSESGILGLFRKARYSCRRPKSPNTPVTPITPITPTSPISASSTSSSPGRQRHKLFGFNSAMRHLLHQQSSHHQHEQQQSQRHQQQHEKEEEETQTLIQQQQQQKAFSPTSSRRNLKLNQEVMPSITMSECWTWDQQTEISNPEIQQQQQREQQAFSTSISNSIEFDKAFTKSSSSTKINSQTSVIATSSCSGSGGGGAAAAARNIACFFNPFYTDFIPSTTNVTTEIVTNVTTTADTGIVSGSTTPTSTTIAQQEDISAKRAKLKQLSNSPKTEPQDELDDKRADFLRATMKICLVVSPPSKLQMKSKSLTHLDDIDSMVTSTLCTARTRNAEITNRGKCNTKATIYDIFIDSTEEEQQQQRQQQQQQQSQIQHQEPKLQQEYQELTHSPSSLLLNVSSDSNCSFSPITTSASFTTMVTANVTGGSASSTGTLSTTSLSGASSKRKSSFMQRKKPMLQRSEITSAEYFAIAYMSETGQLEEEILPVSRGVKLSAAIHHIMKRRNWKFSEVSITENNSNCNITDPAFSVSFDENTDTDILAGRRIILNEKAGFKKALQKASSFRQYARPSRLLYSASAEEPGELATSSKQLKQRWSGLFGARNLSPQTQLNELLTSYAINGIPQRIAIPYSFTQHNYDEALSYFNDMHKSWRDFIASDNMPENEAKIQTAIWELVTTEVYYINALQTLADHFLACLEALQQQNLLTDIDQFRLFANIREICEANLKFWTFHLYPMVAHSIATHEPMRIDFFVDGFINFKTIFEPYALYCAEQSSCQFYCKELLRSNSLFSSYVTWCESNRNCNRLHLPDILVRPMQRLTKYSLLLTAIKKHMTADEDIESVDGMLHSVENFVSSVNNLLSQRQEEERIKGVMARIEGYEIVPSCGNEACEKIIKQFGANLNLCSYMKNVRPPQTRHLFMEGDQKFRDNAGKFDVHCFLFTDLFLICKYTHKKGSMVKVVRQPFFTDRLLIHRSLNTLNCVYLNELNLAITSFTLTSPEAHNWLEALRRARSCYTKLKQSSINFESTQSFIQKQNSFGTTTATASTTTINTITSGVCNIANMGPSIDTISIRKTSPASSALCSQISSTNNSHSGSVELYDSRNISIDCEKTNSVSSDDGSGALGKSKNPKKLKPKTSITLSLEPTNNLVQSLPNLNLQENPNNNLYHTYSNTLLVPGTRHSRNLLSPVFNVSYPPPSPTRTPLRRVSAIPSKNNPPLVKTRNVTSQSSINWHQIPPTPTPPTPQLKDSSAIGSADKNSSSAGNPSGSIVDELENEPPKASGSSSNNVAFGGDDIVAASSSPLPTTSSTHSINDAAEELETETSRTTSALATTNTTTEINTDDNILQQQHKMHCSNETDV